MLLRVRIDANYSDYDDQGGFLRGCSTREILRGYVGSIRTAPWERGRDEPKSSLSDGASSGDAPTA